MPFRTNVPSLLKTPKEESGEDWFFDYEKQGMIKGVELLPPHSHPENQPVPGPAGRVPANWESL